jgi:hypothetical protein
MEDELNVGKKAGAFLGAG